MDNGDHGWSIHLRVQEAQCVDLLLLLGMSATMQLCGQQLLEELPRIVGSIMVSCRSQRGHILTVVAAPFHALSAPMHVCSNSLCSGREEAQ